jgi:phenylalanyl-tRNA synthetase alpha chain
MIEEIKKVLKEVEELTAANAGEIEALRIKYLSKKGEIARMMNNFRDIASEQKKEVGQHLNSLKEKAQQKINELRDKFAESDDRETGFDLTRTSYPIHLGSRHPLSIVQKEICDIFGRVGFNIASGPEIDDDNHVFSMLNFPDNHPARDMQDTFFIEKPAQDEDARQEVILRTHTSSVQIRVMTEQKPPIRIICPGRVYRNEAISYRAHCFFHQVEALCVDHHISFADLRETLDYFAREMFGSETKTRLRPSYFPFTEPSGEMDISCNLCGGKGCPFCKHTGWVEILGCGMVDPAVLSNCGIDPDRYTGYALGMGIERIANLKYRVNDLRLFSENDLRFLQQFNAAN